MIVPDVSASTKRDQREDLLQLILQFTKTFLLILKEMRYTLNTMYSPMAQIKWPSLYYFMNHGQVW